ncbi:MAG: superoxide dismutase [Bacteroidales bacterium]|jgi:Fe-Mn family superoxide dismutase
MNFELSELPYDLNALEPYISRMNLELHHEMHNQTYIKNLNRRINGTKFKNLDLETIIKVADGPVFNFASQVWNHAFYFESLKAGNNNTLKGPFADVIRSNFGSVSFFKNSFFKAALSLFGAGWVWLVLNPKGLMEIIQKSNAGNPLRIGLIPLLTCDLWEHAYYLDYQDKRKDYLEAFWKLINWEMIEKRYNEFTAKVD